jgi:hypothetical protein
MSTVLRGDALLVLIVLSSTECAFRERLNFRSFCIERASPFAVRYGSGDQIGTETDFDSILKRAAKPAQSKKPNNEPVSYLTSR